MFKEKQAFTLVELIVVIFILAILSSIGLMALSWYLATARDSTRVIEFEDIESAMGSFMINNWFYPNPTNPVEIYYSWWLVWTQWILWSQLVKSIWFWENISDPLTKNPYTYSLENSRKTFSIAWVLEEKLVEGTLDTLENVALIKWNYNWEIIKTKSDNTNYILALPSIVLTDTSYTDLIDIINNNKLVYSDFENLPASYSWTKYNIDANLDFSANNLVIFSWSISDLKDINNQVLLLQNLYTAYTWSLLWEKLTLSNLNYSELFLSSPWNKIQTLACDTVNFKLKYPVKCK